MNRLGKDTDDTQNRKLPKTISVAAYGLFQSVKKGKLQYQKKFKNPFCIGY